MEYREFIPQKGLTIEINGQPYEEIKITTKDTHELVVLFSPEKVVWSKTYNVSFKRDLSQMGTID